MKRVWHTISRIGVGTIGDPLELQSVIVTNRISTVALLLMLVVGTLLGIRQWNAEPILIFSLSAIFGFILLLVHRQYFSAARLLLCLILPLIVIGMSVISKKIPGEEITESEYYDYRFVLLATSVVPPLIFSFARKTLLAVSILPYLILFILFDPIHNYFNVGFDQIDHSLPSYNISGWIAMLMFCTITLGVLILRRTTDEVQIKNAQLIDELDRTNTLLEEQRHKIEEANERIQSQNEGLSLANSKLANKVALVNDDLEKTNRQLIKHNNELQQFSYAVSHNLRGPVASLLGLVELANKEALFNNHDVFGHINKSVRRLDNIVRDLGRILEMRKDIARVREHIDIGSLIDDVVAPFQKEIVDHGIKVDLQLQCEDFYSIKPMLNSIVYNLFSNAVKYRAKTRVPVIMINTIETDEHFQFTINDNGIGIDLETHREEMFQLFKRFNSHTEGKGIGLYLCDLQVKALGGYIEVESRKDEFTEFRVILAKPEDLEKQILLENPYSEIFFDATRDLIGITWKREVRSKEFRSVLESSLVGMKEYNVAHWFMDIRKRKEVEPEDQIWLLETILPSIFKLGLKRLAVVYAGEINPNTKSFYEGNQKVFKKHNIQVFFSKSKIEAKRWLDESKIMA